MKEVQGDGQGGEYQTHRASRCQVHKSSTEFRDNNGQYGGVEETPALVGDVDSRLGIGSRVVHHLEEEVGVVRDKSVAGHLSEETEENGDDDTLSHGLGREHNPPRLLRILHFNLNGGADLSHFGVDKDRAGIAFGVVFGENGKRFFVTVVGNQPTRTFGEEAVGALSA